MALQDKKGIALASGFILNSESLLDMRGCNDTVQELQEILNGGADPIGLTSYVKEDKGFYVYTGTQLENLRAIMSPASDSEDGKAGLVPAPTTSDGNKYLASDGTWKSITIPKYDNATTSNSGLMSAADKTKLDGISEGANKYVHPSYTAQSNGMYKITVDATGHVSGASLITKEDLLDLGIADGDNVYGEFVGASQTMAGEMGLVPAPEAGENNLFLRGDGTWDVPFGGIGILSEWGSESTDIP